VKVVCLFSFLNYPSAKEQWDCGLISLQEI